MLPISSFFPSGGLSSPPELFVRVRLLRCSCSEGVLFTPAPRFASSWCGCREPIFVPLPDFLRFETSAAGSSYSSPPKPMMSGTCLTKLTLSPFLRPVLSPPGPGDLPALPRVVNISLLLGHRCAAPVSSRGGLTKAAAACCALSVDGFRNAFRSASSSLLLLVGFLTSSSLSCLGNASSAFANSFAFHLDAIVSPASTISWTVYDGSECGYRTGRGRSCAGCYVACLAGEVRYWARRDWRATSMTWYV
jgi:hypothetical protein